MALQIGLTLNRESFGATWVEKKGQTKKGLQRKTEVYRGGNRGSEEE